MWRGMAAVLDVGSVPWWYIVVPHRYNALFLVLVLLAAWPTCGCLFKWLHHGGAAGAIINPPCVYPFHVTCMCNKYSSPAYFLGGTTIKKQTTHYMYRKSSCSTTVMQH